jgi:F-type H+-transporting ATPase subunit b
LKSSLKRVVLAGLTLAVLLGLGIYPQRARAQEAGAAGTTTAQPAEKNAQEQDETEAYRKSPMVVALGAKLGMNADQSATAFELTNFAVLAVALGWLVVKLVPRTLRDRNTSIQKQLVDARTATEEARVRLSGVEERLAKLDGEIAAMAAQAEKDLAREEQRIKASVGEEAKKILAAAEQEIAAATMHAQKQLQQHAAELAIEQAARKLVVSAETDRLLVQGFAQRLTGDESKKGQN